LAEAVLIDEVAEVAAGFLRLVVRRRRHHSELIGRPEVLQDRTRGAVVARAAPVALVDDDQVEEVGWVSLEQPLA
jgi:hypothetical protein